MFELKAQGRIAGSGRLDSGKLAVFEHRVDDQIAAVQSVVRMIDRRVVSWRLWQSGN